MLSENVETITGSDYLFPTIKFTELNINPPFALVIGDTHGSRRYTLELIKEASLRGVTKIIQLGDWGYLWPDTNLDDRTESINVVSSYLLDANITMFFIRGNHDWKEGIEKNQLKLRELGFHYLDDGWHDIGFKVPTFFYGGAISIDRKYRKEGTDYFKDEKPEHIDRATLMRKDPWVNPAILFSHDAPHSPPGFEKPHALMVGDEELISDCHWSQCKVNFVARQAWVTSIFHGHYHTGQRYKFDQCPDRCEIHALNQVGDRGDSVYLDVNGEVTV